MRALLFVPGSDERKLAKVTSFGADVIVVDLEDAVADDRKTAARATTRSAIESYSRDQVNTVRVNGIETGRLHDDIAAVVCSNLDAVVVPKIEDTETLAEADRALAAAEQANGMEAGSVRAAGDPRDAAGNQSLRRDPRPGPGPDGDRDLRARRLLGCARRRADRGRGGARLRAREGSRGHPGRGDGGADRRPVSRRRGCRRASGRLAAAADAGLSGASGRVPAAGPGDPPRLLGADRRGGHPYPTGGRGVRGGRVPRGRLAARRRPLRRLPDLLPGPPQADPLRGLPRDRRVGSHERHAASTGGDPRRRCRVAVRRAGDRDDARRLRRRRDQGRASRPATTCASSAGRRTACLCGGR